MSIGKIDRMQENLIAYFRLFAGLPGATFVEDDVTWFVNARDEPGNHVLRARISEDSIDRRIDEIIEQFSHYAELVDWLVFPGCQPADLGKRLEARGMPGGLAGTWMLADLSASLPTAPPVPDGFHVRQVTDTTMLEALIVCLFAAVSARWVCWTAVWYDCSTHLRWAS